MSEPTPKTGSGLDPKTAGVLCYVLGWITGIIFLILEKKDQSVRFHAIQSIVVFGAITVVAFIFDFLPGAFGDVLGWLLGALAFILWIVLMVKAYRGEKYKLPIAGDIAENNSKPAAQ